MVLAFHRVEGTNRADLTGSPRLVFLKGKQACRPAISIHYSIGLGWSLRRFISIKLPSGLQVAGPRTNL